jgi:hypothetical protein
LLWLAGNFNKNNLNNKNNQSDSQTAFPTSVINASPKQNQLDSLAGNNLKTNNLKVKTIIETTPIIFSPKTLKKVKLKYNNEEFEVYVGKNFKLTEENIKFLYEYWKKTH